MASRGKFVCLSPLIGGDATDETSEGKKTEKSVRIGRGNHFTHEKSRRTSRRELSEKLSRKMIRFGVCVYRAHDKSETKKYDVGCDV